jgi:CDP-paratose 2-epimerase
MKKVLVTGAGGLIGSEVVLFFSQKGMEVVGIDNNMRQVFFGEKAVSAVFHTFFSDLFNTFEKSQVLLERF